MDEEEYPQDPQRQRRNILKYRLRRVEERIWTKTKELNHLNHTRLLLVDKIYEVLFEEKEGGDG